MPLLRLTGAARANAAGASKTLCAFLQLQNLDHRQHHYHFLRRHMLQACSGMDNTSAARVSSTMWPMFRSGIKELLATGAVSDLTIICGRDRHRAHKTVLFLHGGKFRQLVRDRGQSTRDITIPHDSPIIFDAVLRYLYTFEFDRSAPYQYPPFQYAAEVYLMAVKYDVQGLPELALKRCAKACVPGRDLSPLSQAIHIAKQCKVEGDSELWKVVSKVVGEHYELLVKRMADQERKGSLFGAEVEHLTSLLEAVKVIKLRGTSLLVSGGVAKEKDNPDGEKKQSPSQHEAKTANKTSTLPPHLRCRNAAQTDSSRGSGKSSGAAQVAACETSFTPSAATVVDKDHANTGTQKAASEELPNDAGNIMAQAASASRPDWDDSPEENWHASPGIPVHPSTWPGEDNTYWADDRPSGNSFQGAGRTLGEPNLNTADRLEKEKVGRGELLAVAEAKTAAKKPSEWFKTKHLAMTFL